MKHERISIYFRCVKCNRDYMDYARVPMPVDLKSDGVEAVKDCPRCNYMNIVQISPEDMVMHLNHKVRIGNYRMENRLRIPVNVICESCGYHYIPKHLLSDLSGFSLKVKCPKCAHMNRREVPKAIVGRYLFNGESIGDLGIGVKGPRIEDHADAKKMAREPGKKRKAVRARPFQTFMVWTNVFMIIFILLLLANPFQAGFEVNDVVPHEDYRGDYGYAPTFILQNKGMWSADGLRVYVKIYMIDESSDEPGNVSDYLFSGYAIPERTHVGSIGDNTVEVYAYTTCMWTTKYYYMMIVEWDGGSESMTGTFKHIRVRA